MRVTSLDGCYNFHGSAVPGTDGFVSETNVSTGFVSVAFTANVTEPEELTVVNANGQTCVRDSGCPEFNGYTLEITFCEVSPCLFAMLTGQDVVENALGEPIGFTMNSKVSVCGLSGFALELWSGVPGVACGSGGEGSFGYLLLPAVRPGIIGDFTIENAAVSFVVQNAITQDGNNWGIGPSTFLPLNDITGAPRPVQMLDPNDHLFVAYTNVAPPADTDGCVPLDHIEFLATRGIAGSPGTWTPVGGTPPANAADATAKGITAQPTTLWTPGQYVQGLTDGAPGEMYWNGTAWGAGRARVPATGATAGSPGVWTPAGSQPPANATAAGIAGIVATPNTAWTTGQYVQGSTLGAAGQMYWSGSTWIGGGPAALAADGAGRAKK
jgi:hypothetical protein